MNIAEFNRLDDRELRATLERCCGASRWLVGMMALKPFESFESVQQQAEKVWQSLDETDWLEAFRHHPKIGDVNALRKKFASTAKWAAGEQGGASQSSDEILEELRQVNNEYEKKYDFIFIVCATGKSGAQMLEILKVRMKNDRPTELKNAAAEQLKITKLRLEKL